MDAPFIPGISPPPNLPLERFLPPLPVGMSYNWLKQHLPKGAWVLDPFGNSPLLPIELAKAGFRVLVTANNPIHAFMLEMLSSAPIQSALEEALANLAQAPIADKGLVETYIRSFYKAACSQCGNDLEVNRFLWRRDEEFPFAFLADCPVCGFGGEHPVTDSTRQIIKALPPIGLHRARALESIVALNDPLRGIVENALNCYLPRPLIILQTLINKISTLSLPESQKQCLRALILSACDQANTLWAYPTARNRPRQLTVPSVIQEFNLWQVLLSAIQTWQMGESSISLKHWPDLPPPSGGISLFNGRFRELSPLPDSDLLQAIVSIVPRPNQAFWTLSAAWTGWLWGQDAVTPLKNALSRQRYDWNWHTNALRSILQSLHKTMKNRTPLFMIIVENEHDFLSAGMLAAGSVGFELKSIALSGDGLTAQCLWSNASIDTSTPTQGEQQRIIQAAVTEHLTKRAEPVSYQYLHAAILVDLSTHHILAHLPENFTDLSISELNKQINPIFMDPSLLIRYGGGPVSLDTGLYWLKMNPPHQPALIDRVETTILNHFRNTPLTTYQEIRKAVYQVCQGLMTPEDEIILACLNAYADPIAPENTSWALRESEDIHSRLSDVTEIKHRLQEIALDLGFNFKEEAYKAYWYLDITQEYVFFINTTAIISPFLFAHQEMARRKVILLPGSRANLLAYKLKRDPRLQAAMGESWQCVKFRQLRTIGENPLLTRDLFISQIKEDPPEFQASQLALF